MSSFMRKIDKYDAYLRINEILGLTVVSVSITGVYEKRATPEMGAALKSPTWISQSRVSH